LHKTRNPTATRIKPDANALAERQNSRLQSQQQRIFCGNRRNWQHSFLIDTAQLPRLPPGEIFQRRPKSSPAETMHTGPHWKIFIIAVIWDFLLDYQIAM
jgi:hypothetical protein